MYKYEMHCHTAEASKCGHATGAEMADFYKSMGYSGLVISDHFFNGNCAVPSDLAWEERVELFYKGYEAAKKRGDEIGLSVYFAWENSYSGTDFLVYGLDKDWLLAHEYCDLLPAKKHIELAHKSGGFVVQAHPFRERGYIEMIRLLPRDVDAVEAINAANADIANEMAELYADKYGLLKTCGTDNHHGKGARLTALELDFEAKSMDEIIDAIKHNKHKNSLIKLD